MKKVFVCLFLLCAMTMHAVNYCASQSWGYAGSLTGGGNATPTLVSSVSELQSALGNRAKNKVVIITANLTFTSMTTIQDAENITLMALPGVKLTSNKQSKNESGILFIKRSTNVILRNLTFIGPGAYDVDGNDNLCFEDVTNTWVDHCDFQDGMDGNFDIKGESDNITVTWCLFRYLKEPRAGGTGGADDHRFTNLMGSGSSDKPADNWYNVTYGYCWWDDGCKERMVRCRNAELHFLNCYWNSSVANYYVGPENVKAYFEGCTFEGNANSASKIWKTFGNTINYCTFVNCSGNLPSNSSTPVSAPSYSYDQLSASVAKGYVTNSTCGAGATLTVTNSAEVSSACDDDEPIDPQPGTTSNWWNFSDEDFSSLGNITSETTVRGLHIVATEEKYITVETLSAEQVLGDETFTYRFKFNGSGSADYRHVWFGVSGECTVEIYLISAKNTETRTLNIATGSFANVQSTLSAEPTLTKKTYHYTGDATTIYLYSANSGINLYGIRLVYPGSQTAVTPVFEETPAQKVLHDGQVLIQREGKTYNLLGTRVH